MKRKVFESYSGETEHILLSGTRVRRPTIFLRVGNLSFSKKAFILGLCLIVLQFLDGLLTYVGLSLYGIQMEGNKFLRMLIEMYGLIPSLFGAKFLAVILSGGLLYAAHTRRWLRPLMLLAVAIYIGLAVVPWMLLISWHYTSS